MARTKKKKKEKTFLDMIKLDFKNMILGNIILQILFLLFGIIIFMHPYFALKTVGIIIGIYFIFFGIYGIYEYVFMRDMPIFNVKIFLGILAILAGIFIMVNPFKLFKVLTLALGIYLIISSICKILEAFKLKKCGYDGWLIMLVTSIILLIFGIFTAINPLATMDIVEVCGIFIILSSILEICNLIMIYTKAKDVMKMLKKAK